MAEADTHHLNGLAVGNGEAAGNVVQQIGRGGNIHLKFLAVNDLLLLFAILGEQADRGLQGRGKFLVQLAAQAVAQHGRCGLLCRLLALLLALLLAALAITALVAAILSAVVTAILTVAAPIAAILAAGVVLLVVALGSALGLLGLGVALLRGVGGCCLVALLVAVAVVTSAAVVVAVAISALIAALAAVFLALGRGGSAPLCRGIEISGAH